MWNILAHHVEYQPQGDQFFSIPILEPLWWDFSWWVRFLSQADTYLWYDDWLSRFPREHEWRLVEQAIDDVRTQKKRIHIRGISTREGIEAIRDYYASCGYEDELAKNYTLPAYELLTVSISLRHALWCAKDKDFLDMTKVWAIIPPLRWPADLRSLQQALRMGIIMGLEVASGDDAYLSWLLEKQILPVFHVGQMTAFRWQYHGFTGVPRQAHIPIPHFLQPKED